MGAKVIIGMEFIIDGNQTYKPTNFTVFQESELFRKYKVFCFLSKNHEKLYEDAEEYLTLNLDIELFLDLLKEKKDKKEELILERKFQM